MLPDGRWCRVPAPHFGPRESGDPTPFLPKQDSVSAQGRTSAGSKAARAVAASVSSCASASGPRFSASQVPNPGVVSKLEQDLSVGAKQKKKGLLHLSPPPPPHSAEAGWAGPGAPRSQSSCPQGCEEAGGRDAPHPGLRSRALRDPWEGGRRGACASLLRSRLTPGPRTRTPFSSRPSDSRCPHPPAPRCALTGPTA